MIVDGHCHAWRRWPYGPPAVPDPDTRGCVELLLFELDRHGIDEAILICARIGDNDDNIEYALEAAARYPGRLHVFPDVDCFWSDDYHRRGVADRLRALIARHPVRGVTHYLARDNDGWLRSSEARDLLEVAQEHELILSLSVSPVWFEDLGLLADCFPTVPILCHHLGEVTTEKQLDELLVHGAATNLIVKISGFHYVAERGWDFPFEPQLAMVRRLYEAVGPNRLCWGSDFPACVDHVTYRQSLELVRDRCHFMSEADLDLVLGRTLDNLLRNRGRPGSAAGAQAD